VQKLGKDFASDLEAHAEMIARGADCARCPLYGERRGPVASELRKSSKLIVIGEAPGKHEVRRGKPFVGDSGDELTFGLTDGGLSRGETSIINVCACQPPDEMQRYVKQSKRRGAKSPIDCCRPRFIRDLKDALGSGARTILGLGSTAHASIAKAYGIGLGKEAKKKHGQHLKSEKRLAAVKDHRGHPFDLVASPRALDPSLPPATLFPSFHPAYALREAHYMLHVIRDDIANASRIAVNGGWPGYKLPSDFLVVKSATAMGAWLDAALASGRRVTVDIETNGLDAASKIRCIGLGYFVDDEPDTRPRIMVVPLRRKNGAVTWPATLAPGVKLKLREFLDAAQLAFHNGAFDTKVLIRNGYLTKTRKQWWDTAIAHHVTHECDCPHNLAFVSSRFAQVPLWKDQVDHKAADSEDQDEELWHYNGTDVDMQATTYRGLRRWVKEAQNENAFRLDTRKAPIARDMGELGLFIDEGKRRDMETELHGWLTRRQSKLAGIVGREDFNPRSPKQLTDWLYSKMGWTPIINTDAEEWEDGDAAATSIDSLCALEDSKQLTPVGIDFVNTLIEFKELEKLRAQFVVGMVKHLRPTEWDGIYHLPVTYLVHVVPTGRWSSTPNIQNWPSNGRLNVRTLCVAPPGHVIVGADYEQIEARIYAVLANDQRMLQAFADELDVHSDNAAAMYAEPGATDARIREIYHEIIRLKNARKQFTDDQWRLWNSAAADPLSLAMNGAVLDYKRAKVRRDAAKTFVYLLLYGGEKDKLYESMRKKREKGKGTKLFPDLLESDITRWHDNWGRLHPETAAWHTAIESYVRKHNCVATAISGRVRWFPGGPTQKNAAANTTVQGSAADIADEKVIELDAFLPHRGWSRHSGMFGQIHDWLGGYAPIDRAEEARSGFQRIMPYRFRDMDIPCKALVTANIAQQSE
jgi:uracil-DNA glycosylase family 4